MYSRITVYTDGGSRGNPGPAGAGFDLYDQQGSLIFGKGLFLGKTTNNVAEYSAMLGALKAVLDLGVREVTIYSDSQLMVRQLLGEYKVKSPGLKEFYDQCVKLLDKFTNSRIEHVYREQNTLADKLANQAMDAKHDIDLKPESGHEPLGKKLQIGRAHV